MKNEHYETRNFSIFIANKQWVNNILRPLLELSADDDSHLAINIAGLVLVLVRRMSDKALMLLSEQKKKSKAKSKSKKFLQSVAPTTTADENNKSIALSDSEVEDDEPKVTSSALQNAIDQLKALLSFKTGLCSEKANLAITNAFRDFWIKEQAESNPGRYFVVLKCEFLDDVFPLD